MEIPENHLTREELTTYVTGTPGNFLIERVEHHILDCAECARAVNQRVRESMRQNKAQSFSAAAQRFV
jgi:hypothetical protein